MQRKRLKHMLTFTGLLYPLGFSCVAEHGLKLPWPSAPVASGEGFAVGFSGRVMPSLTAGTFETPHQHSGEMLSELIAVLILERSCRPH